MAFTSNKLVIENENKETIEQPTSLHTASELNLAELEFLLKVIGNADLKGHQVEMFYTMALKLQNQYIVKSK